MKTDKFEKTIRQKLESISPDFQEDDWAKMQNYMHAHTPPTFWQQYGSWLGYAAAASVSTVMAFLYVNQLSQNDNLVSDVKKLQNQIEVIKSAPVSAPKTQIDTVYIVQKEITRDQFLHQESQNVRNSDDNNLNNTIERQNEESEIAQQNSIQVSPDFKKTTENVIAAKSDQTDLIKEKAVQKPASDQADKNSQENIVFQNQTRYTENTGTSKNTQNTLVAENKASSGQVKPSGSSGGTTGNSSGGVYNSGKTLDENFNQLSELQSLQFDNNSRTPFQMNYALANRLSGKQVKKALLAANPVDAEKNITDNKKTEKTTQAENTIPRLNLKVPYRFGAGIQFEGKNQIKTVTGEVLVSKRFSVSTGVSWLKVKPMEFFTEKIFREKNRSDFKKSHPNQVPMAFEILNIKVNPTLVQIPLTVAFRNSVGQSFSYFIGAGTNFTVNGKEKFSYDCRIPYLKQEFFTKSFERKMDVPIINSVNFSAGIEKNWHPIVVQVEGYVYSYFKQLSPDNQRTGPGVKIKLLYQIGGKM